MKEVIVKATAPQLEIALSGEIDAENAEEFFEVVAGAYAEHAGDIVFDCAALQFIDSTTLGTFVKILKRVKSNGHNMKLKGLSPRLKKLFVICALDTIMEIEG